ncbi:MAG: hypothetical protein ACI8RU_002532, partial [Zhongshania aliphaticivorans]
EAFVFGRNPEDFMLLNAGWPLRKWDNLRGGRLAGVTWSHNIIPHVAGGTLRG